MSNRNDAHAPMKNLNALLNGHNKHLYNIEPLPRHHTRSVAHSKSLCGIFILNVTKLRAVNDSKAIYNIRTLAFGEYNLKTNKNV